MKKLYVGTNRRADVFINAVPLPKIGVKDVFRYLGHNYEFSGAKFSTLEDLQPQLLNIQRAPLKPQQKLNILKFYLLPRYIYLLQNPGVTLKSLNSADRLVRLAVKKILHLPESTTNAYLYSRPADGGLGIMNFSRRIPGILLRRLENLGTLEDAHIQSLVQNHYIRKLSGKLTRWLGDIGPDPKNLARFWSGKLEDSVSGGGLWQVGGCSGSHGWVQNPPDYWTGGDFVKAVQLRGNLLPVHGGVHNRTGNNLCRGCHLRRETVCHILQRCPVVHAERIARHDHAVNRIAAMARTNHWDVVVEPRIHDATGALHKPDLLLIKGEEVVIGELGIHWEGPDILEVAHRNKKAHYTTPLFLESMQRRFPDKNIRVMPMIIGARGGWCPNNNHFANIIGLSRENLRSIVCDVLKGGWMAHAKFATRVWDRRL